MHRMTHFSVSKQDEICHYLEKIAQPNIEEQKASEVILRKGFDSFIIDKEITKTIIRDEKDKSRYFQVYFYDTRMDHFSFQITPTAAFIKGILTVNDRGELSVRPGADCEFAFVNATFSYNAGKLEFDDNSDKVENEGSLCNKLLEGCRRYFRQ